ncbi:energy-coupling factor ABC transporter ATP-binding protein [Paenibacillus sp. N4]|uniref:energy-coupling factor ABC transporter ATP-binding protein n=1 Tax=Paenibacillus vietnamensis TaxID=2590547 RepID=UPI001CD094C9|nr:ABC transporter ATP-binding protein [Paenibacillus vietnamensis]MCA0754120.1 energy-coupling factor ABC transporter ATP-binding protein [Paenibacillus vietnamensis]
MEQIYQVELKKVSVTPPALHHDGETVTILKDVSFSIYEGEWVTLLGRNGSGKSTLAKAVAGCRIPGATGSRSSRLQEAAEGKPLPIVLQHPEASLLGATPWEDVVLLLEQNGLQAETIAEEAERALSRAGLGERLWQPIETLSGGQKQLVAIAGCLAMRSPLLVLDEVTAMLETEAAAGVLEQVRQLHRTGVTVLWITQKLDEIEQGDRVAAMSGGRLVFDGTAEQWFDRAGAAENMRKNWIGEREAAGCGGAEKADVGSRAGLRFEPGKQGISCSGSEDGKLSMCERLGFAAPYAVQVAWELERLGVKLRPLPFTAEMLAEAVKRYGG